MITISTHKSIMILACVLIGTCAVTALHAQETDTLKKIKASNTLVIGHRDVSVPFSFLDDKQQPIGYSIDLCLKIVEAIRTTQKLPKLQVKMQAVTAATRIPLIANGTIDMECGATTNTVERQQQVSFVVTTFVAATRLASKKSANFKSLNDLKGKTLVAVAGTTNLRQITELNGQRGLGMTLVPAKHHNDAFAMLEKGEAVAFASDDILLYGIIAGSSTPDSFVVSNESLSVEPYGIMLRRDDKAFKKVADDAIRALFKSGEIQKIYAKWFTTPIPPKNISLNAPMSEVLKKVIAKPTDSGIAADY
jgi:glutamate/aspartate transport system substrate-binding protein